MSSTISTTGDGSSDSSFPSSLEPFGWSAEWQTQLASAGPQPDRIGRVTTAHRTRCDLVTDQGPASATCAGHCHHASPLDRPVVGDWVALRHENGGSLVIEAILPRRSLLRRLAAGGHDSDQAMAAHVDTVFIVGGLDGDHEPRRLRRSIAFATGGGATPVVLLNKADLVVDPSMALADLAGIDPGIPVHAISARDGQGLEALEAYLLPGHTVACVGSSGVGKSTLINRLLGHDDWARRCATFSP